MRWRRGHRAWLAAVFFLWAGTGIPYAGTDPNAPEKSEAPLPDSDLLGRMHSDNLLAIHLGRSARTQAAAPDVRAYGARIVRDHEALDAKVRALGTRLGLKFTSILPSDPEGDRVTALKGAPFDHAFVALMAQRYLRQVTQLEHQQQLLGKDSPVEDLADQVLPTLRRHYQDAARLGGSPQ